LRYKSAEPFDGTFMGSVVRGCGAVEEGQKYGNTNGLTAAMTRAIAQAGRRQAIGHAHGRLRVFRRRRDDCVAAFTSGRKGKIEGWRDERGADG
jgi:hypothetical protein